jgi:hypothetical protein
METLIFRPEAYGAVADGIQDNSPAFWRALEEASRTPGATLELLPGKTYYFAPKPCHTQPVTPAVVSGSSQAGQMAVIVLNAAQNLTIRGQNTTLLTDAPLYFADITNTCGVLLEGLNFDYRVRPFAGAHTLALNMDGCFADVETDRPLGIDAFWNAPRNSWFGVLDKPTGRWHMFISGYEPLEGENRYRVLFGRDEATLRRLPLLLENRLILPVPGVGHMVERAFSVVGNTDFTMRDCNIRSYCRFGFALFRNEGTVRFERVNAVPAPDETLPICGWRDGFHVKENRAKYIWDHCRADGMYDDIFNISSSMLCVRKVFAPDDLDLFWPETQKAYVPLQPGDTMTVFDEDTGELLGSSSLREVVEQSGSVNRIRLTDPIPNIREGEHIRVCFDSMVAPGSEILSCDFRGTMRFRGPITIRDCYFYVARMWIDLCIPVEGPIPRGIHFTNCRFDCDDQKEVYFHVESQRRGSSGQNQYHLENIVFEKCALSPANFGIGVADAPYVKFR